jgi:hypothetical protein
MAPMEVAIIALPGHFVVASNGSMSERASERAAASWLLRLLTDGGFSHGLTLTDRTGPAPAGDTTMTYR